MTKQNKLVGGILLVSGTTIGAGMLALPVISGFAGFFPTLLLFTIFWIYMTYTAFLVLEANLWMEENTNLISMAKKTLGRWGEAVSWVTYLFLLYSLTTAYIAGSGLIIADLVESLTGYRLSSFFGSLPLLIIFGICVYRGTRYVDHANRWLMGGLIATYTLMVLFLTPHVETAKLMHADWKYLALSVSVVATSFGFHIIIPTLSTYVHKDLKILKKSIFIGSLIPLVVYCLWEFLTLGIIPLEGPNSVLEGFRDGSNGAHLLASLLDNPLLSFIARCFSFFAIVTSFLGVSLSLSDFLADGFKIKRSPRGNDLICILTFLPPITITILDPRAFLSALSFAGAFGVVIILGFIPALMVWRGRYKKHYKSTFKTPGGKLGLILAMLFSTAVIALEVANKLGLIKLFVE